MSIKTPLMGEYAFFTDGVCWVDDLRYIWRKRSDNVTLFILCQLPDQSCLSKRGMICNNVVLHV